MAKGMLVMEAVGDEELYAYLKLRFLRAVWQPAWRSCQPLSAQRSSLLPCLHCPFHPHCISLSWSSTFSSCPALTVRICSTPTCPGLPRDQVYVQLGGGDPPSPRHAGTCPTSRQGGLSVTMAIRVFQLLQCQIYSGEEKQSHYLITLMRSVGKGTVYLWGRVLPFSPKGVGIPSFSFSVRCWRFGGLSALLWDGSTPGGVGTRCMCAGWREPCKLSPSLAELG